MRALILILYSLGVSACQKEPQIDCYNLNMESVDRCFKKNEARGEAKMFVACLPFSERLTTRGLWVRGFEKNVFFEGDDARSHPPPDMLWYDNTGAKFILDDEVQVKGLRDPTMYYALEVEVVGRRALCSMATLNPYPIAVEKLKIKRLIRM